MENLKKYIKEHNKIEQYFYTGAKEKTIEEKYQFIKNHFQYFTMNSWNQTKSIANNVKIYNLGLTSEQQNGFFEIMDIDPDFISYNLEFYIEEFQKISGVDIFFNGRSAGYIVLDLEKTDREEIEIITNYNTYKEYKKESNEFSGGCFYQYLPANYSRKDDIEKLYIQIKAFDKFCDILRNELIYILNNYSVSEHVETYTKLEKDIILD